jgi:hypothetical protein
MEEFGEILDVIYLVLSIANKGGPDTACSSLLEVCKHLAAVTQKCGR